MLFYIDDLCKNPAQKRHLQGSSQAPLPVALEKEVCVLCGAPGPVQAEGSPVGYVNCQEHVCSACFDPETMLNYRRDWPVLQDELRAKKLAFDPVLECSLVEFKDVCVVLSRMHHADHLQGKVMQTLASGKPSEEELLALFELTDPQDRKRKQIAKLYRLAEAVWRQSPRQRVKHHGSDFDAVWAAAKVVSKDVAAGFQPSSSRPGPFWEQELNQELKRYGAKLEAWNRTLIPVTLKFAVTKLALAAVKGDGQESGPVLYPLRVENLGLPGDSAWIKRAKEMAERWPGLAGVEPIES